MLTEHCSVLLILIKQILESGLYMIHVHYAKCLYYVVWAVNQGKGLTGLVVVQHNAIFSTSTSFSYNGGTVKYDRHTQFIVSWQATVSCIHSQCGLLRSFVWHSVCCDIWNILKLAVIEQSDSITMWILFRHFFLKTMFFIRDQGLWRQPPQMQGVFWGQS